jgi:hypothetical protein
MEGDKNDIGWVDFTYQWDIGRRWDDAFSQFIRFSNINQRKLIAWIMIKTRVSIFTSSDSIGLYKLTLSGLSSAIRRCNSSNVIVGSNAFSENHRTVIPRDGAEHGKDNAEEVWTFNLRIPPNDDRSIINVIVVSSFFFRWTVWFVGLAGADFEQIDLQKPLPRLTSTSVLF